MGVTSPFFIAPSKRSAYALALYWSSVPYESQKLYRRVLIQIHKRWSSAARQVSQRLLIVWGDSKWDEGVPHTSVDRL